MYCDVSGMDSIPPTNTCQAGYHCPAGSDKATDSSCDRYYHCPAGSSEQKKCLPGTFQPNRQEDNCISCEKGKMCDPRFDRPENCPKGFTCEADIGIDPNR